MAARKDGYRHSDMKKDKMDKASYQKKGHRMIVCQLAGMEANV